MSPTDDTNTPNHVSQRANPVLVALSTIAGLRAVLTSPPGSGFQGAVPDPVALSRYLSRDFPSALAAAERAIADALPALTEDDVIKLANGDHAVREELTRWRDTFDFVDVTGLTEAAEGDETWDLLAGGSSRFEVREVPRVEARKVGGPGEVNAWIVWNNQENEEADGSDAESALGLDSSACAWNEEQARDVARYLESNAPGCDDTVYIVVDTESRDASTSTGYQDARDGDRYGPFSDHDGYDPTDESEAQAAADAANLEDYRSNCADWPFAWNTAPKIDRMYIADFAAAGFVVVEHKPSGDIYAGIDGGGYDFLESHWSRAYLRRFLHGKYAPKCIYLRTDDGLRRVVRAGGAK